MARFTLDFPDRQHDALLSLKEQTGMALACQIRTAIEHWLHRDSLDRHFPSLSGQLTVSSK